MACRLAVIPQARVVLIWSPCPGVRRNPSAFSCPRDSWEAGDQHRGQQGAVFFPANSLFEPPGSSSAASRASSGRASMAIGMSSSSVRAGSINVTCRWSGSSGTITTRGSRRSTLGQACGLDTRHCAARQGRMLLHVGERIRDTIDLDPRHQVRRTKCTDLVSRSFSPRWTTSKGAGILAPDIDAR